jgi:hypothetical protein
VHFLGEIPHEDLSGLYQRAAVHVLPSYREVMPLVCLEAAAAGCRIVSTVVGGVREYFGERAWYCEPGNPKSIRKAVLAALSAPHTEELKNLVLSQYTWERAAQKTLDGYMRLAPAENGTQKELSAAMRSAGPRLTSATHDTHAGCGITTATAEAHPNNHASRNDASKTRSHYTQ